MPPTRRGYQNTSGVSRQTDDGIFYVNGRYLCQRIENGVPCNREFASNSHSISSHNSDFHTPSRYRELMARGEYKCSYDGCSHQSENFQAILAHIRSSHDFKGSSDPLKVYYGIPIKTRRKKLSQRYIPSIKEDDRETTLKDPRENTREELEEHCNEKSEQESEDDHDDDDNSLDLLDPRLRKWDEDNGSGNGGAGNSGQLLSTNVIAASG
ncbi:hypothetical protein EV127DRAFT_78088 [Xylaria flabelliformis]|nr:hypothetical protein EV127DRAFT_78088 [Xylaria flabelliformis]